MPLALLAAQPEALTPATGPAVAPATVVDPPQFRPDNQLASAPVMQAAPSGPPPGSESPSPELADPLVDPATQPNAEAHDKTTHHYPGDSLEGFNRTMFGIQVALDKSIYGPLAKGYQHIVPKPAQSGLRNFFRNLSEPVVFLNDLLQLKPGRAARTLARFTINLTVGLAGLIDVAASKRVNLPHRDNSFGNTLAYYGVHPGSYLFLPLVGPTTLRDFLGGPVDGAVLPLTVGKPFTEWKYKVTSTVITGLDLRARSDAELRALFGGAVDPYATLRSVWLQSRAAEISELHSHRKTPAPIPELKDPLRDPATISLQNPSVQRFQPIAPPEPNPAPN